MTQVTRKGFVNKNGQKVVIVPNVPGATSGNLASFDAEGNLQDSGKTIDQSPTANSTNLVTSGGVKAALDGKQDALTFDATPTEGSNNPVTSGGVKAALDSAVGPEPTRIISIEDAGSVYISLFESPSRGMVARIGIENEGEEVLSAEINAANIANLIRALTNPAAPALNGDSLITNGQVYEALQNTDQQKANYYDGHLTIYNEGQGGGFPVAENSTVVQDLMLFIASVPKGIYYYTFVKVHKDNGTATFPCVVKWLERGTTTIVSINVSNHTFTAKQTGDQWDQAFTVANNSSFFEVL